MSFSWNDFFDNAAEAVTNYAEENPQATQDYYEEQAAPQSQPNYDYYPTQSDYNAPSQSYNYYQPENSSSQYQPTQQDYNYYDVPTQPDFSQFTNFFFGNNSQPQQEQSYQPYPTELTSQPAWSDQATQGAQGITDFFFGGRSSFLPPEGIRDGYGTRASGTATGGSGHAPQSNFVGPYGPDYYTPYDTNDYTRALNNGLNAFLNVDLDSRPPAKSDGLGQLAYSITSPWQAPAKPNQNPFESVFDFGNRAVQSAMGGIGQAINPVTSLPGKALDAAADSNIPLLDPLAESVRTGVRNVGEPIMQGWTSAAGDILSMGAYAGESARALFGDEAAKKRIEQENYNKQQQIYNDALAMGYTQEQAIAKAQAYNPIQELIPGTIKAAVQGVADPETAAREAYYKKVGIIEQARAQALAEGASPAEIQAAVDILNAKLNNPVMIAEYEGLQKAGKLPPIVQLGIELGNPVTNPVGNFAMTGKAGLKLPRAIAPTVAKVEKVTSAVSPVGIASKALEASQLPKIGALLESPQQKAYKLEQAAEQITPALDRYAKSMGSDLPTVAQDFVNNPEFRQSLGFKPGKQTDRLVTAIDQELNAVISTKAAPDGVTINTPDLNPEQLAEALKSNLRQQVKADIIDKKTGEIRPAKNLEQFGPLGAIGRGPAQIKPVTTILSRLQLNNPGRLVRDPGGNIFKSAMEDFNPFGKRELTNFVDDIGLQRPSHLKEGGQSTDPDVIGKPPEKSGKAANALYFAANPAAEITNHAINFLSNKGLLGDFKPTPGMGVNDVVGAWETAIKKNIYDQAAARNFIQSADEKAAQLSKKYGVDPIDLEEAFDLKEFTPKQIWQFAEEAGIKPERIPEFSKELAAQREAVRLEAQTRASKKVDDLFFSYKKNVLEQALSGWFPYNYWPVQNMKWLAGHMAQRPARLAAFVNFIAANQEQNAKEGLPTSAQNNIYLGQLPNGEKVSWDYTSMLPFAPAGGDEGFNIAASLADEGDPATGTNKDLGALLFGQDKTYTDKNGQKKFTGREKGLIPNIYRVHPIIDTFTKTGAIADALQGLKLTSDNLGRPGVKEQQTLGLLPGASLWKSFGAATGLTPSLRAAGLKNLQDLDPESLVNQVLFGPNSGKPVFSAQQEIIRQVEKKQLTEIEGRRALASINAGNWDKNALKALDNVEADTMRNKVLGFFGLPVTTSNRPREQTYNKLQAGYNAVKDKGGTYSNVWNPKTQKYDLKFYEEGERQKYLDQHPGQQAIFDKNLTPEQAEQKIKDDATQEAVSALYDRRGSEKMSVKQFNAEMDKLKTTNPAYFEAQRQRQLDKRSGKIALAPGEEMPDEPLTPEQEASKRKYQESREDYQNLGGDKFDELTAQAGELLKKGDKEAANKIYGSKEYRETKAAQSQFLKDNPDFAKQYAADYREKHGKDLPTPEELDYKEKQAGYYAIGGDKFAQLEAKAKQLSDKGDKKGAAAIYNSKEYKQTQAARNQFLADNPDFADQREAEYIAKYGKAPASDAEIEHKEKLDAYNNIGGEDFDLLGEAARQYTAAGDKKAAAAIYNNPDYIRVQQAREQFLKDNPDFAAQFKKDYEEKYGKPYKPFTPTGSTSALVGSRVITSSNNQKSSYSGSSYTPRVTTNYQPKSKSTTYQPRATSSNYRQPPASKNYSPRYVPPARYPNSNPNQTSMPTNPAKFHPNGMRKWTDSEIRTLLRAGISPSVFLKYTGNATGSALFQALRGIGNDEPTSPDQQPRTSLPRVTNKKKPTYRRRGR